MEEERINFPGAEGKTYIYRWVHISALLRLWLEFAGIKPTGGVIAKHDFETYERWRKKLVIDAGLTRWPHDVLRHTNASFSYSLHGDFDSPAISRKHYIAPATRKEAEQFLQLTPEKIQAVLQLHNNSNPSASDTK